MSAIIIHTAPPPPAPRKPTERTSLLGHARGGSIVSSVGTAGTRPSSILDGSTPKKVLDRVEPLKDSLSTLRFVIVCLGIWSSNFIFAVQSTAIPTLAPSISSGFNHAELASYLGSVFSLSSAAVIPIYGVLMDTLGRTFAMNTGCLFFGLGAVLCALSPNIYVLIAARAFAGLGGGGLLTVSSVITTDLVPLRDRGYYQGIMMTIFGAGNMVGGPLSGWLADHHGWQFAFWIQLPVILFCSVVVTTFLPAARIAPTHKTLLSGLAALDWIGSFFLLGSVTTLILGFSFHTSFIKPWSSPLVWGNLLASVVALVTFVYVERRVENPVVPLSLLKSRHRTAIMASGFFLSIYNQAFMFQIPVYFSVIVNTSTAQAGMLLSICGGIGLAAGSILAGWHIRRGGKYRIVGLWSLIPAVVTSLVAAAWKPTWSWWAYYLTYLPASLGYSIFLCCQLVALISAVDSRSMPKATALLYTIRTVGGTLGVAIGGSIQIGSLTSALRSKFRDHPHSHKIVDAILHSKSAIRQLPPPEAKLALDAYASSISMVFYFCAIISVITIATAVGVQEKEIGGSKGDDREDE